MKILITIVVILTLSACAGLEKVADSPVTAMFAQAAIVSGTAEFIGADADGERCDRARKVRQIGQQVVDAVEGGPEVSVTKAVEIAQDEVSKLDLRDSTRVAAFALIRTLASAVQVKVGDGVLSDKNRVRVAGVIGWSVQAAEGYLEQKCSS